MRTPWPPLCVFAIAAMLPADSGLALINPKFTPVDLVGQSGLIVEVDLRPGDAKDTYRATVRAVVKGKTDEKSLAFDLSGAANAQTVEALRGLLAAADKAPSLFFAGGRGGYLHVGGQWVECLSKPKGVWSFSQVDARMQGVRAGGTDMLRRCVDYILSERRPRVPLEAEAVWQPEPAKLGKGEGRILAVRPVDLSGDGTLLVFIAADSGDRLYACDRKAAGATEVTSARKLQSKSREYAYDALNRLKTVMRKSDDETIATYTYDAIGRRIRKEVENGGLPGDIPDGTTDFLYAGDQCVEERNPFGGEEEDEDTPLGQYVWGLYVDELIQQKDIDGETHTDYYLLSDLLYRSVALTDDPAEGDVAVVEAYDTDAYGHTLVYSGPGADNTWFTDDDVATDEPTCRFVFTGREYDYETGIYCYRARYYQQELGRFVSADPAWDQRLAYLQAHPNRYEYVLSRPAVDRDPSGQIIIGLSGWGNKGAAEIRGICERIKAQVNARKGHVLRRGAQERPPTILNGTDMQRTDTVIEKLRELRETKDVDSCWHEQVILVGYSDGASTIWQLFNVKGLADQTKKALESNHGGHYHVAHVGLIDMIRRFVGPEENNPWGQKGKKAGFDTLGVLDKGSNFFQQEDWFMKGYRITTPPFMSGQVYSVNHGTIIRGPWTQEMLADAGQRAYVEKEQQYTSPDELRRPIVD